MVSNVIHKHSHKGKWYNVSPILRHLLKYGCFNKLFEWFISLVSILFDLAFLLKSRIFPLRVDCVRVIIVSFGLFRVCGLKTLVDIHLLIV